MKTGDIVPTVKATILREGRALILRRAKSNHYGAGIWEFPGGKLEFGESLAEALTREVREETGLSVQLGKLLYAAAPLVGPSRQAFIINYECLSAPGQVVLSEEHQDYLWASRSEMESMLESTILQNLQNNQIFQKLALLE